MADGPAALVLEGELGVGQDRAVAGGGRARAPSACSPAGPVEAETQLPYAALGDLLASLYDEELAELPGPQRHALEVALLRAEPREQQLQRAVALGLLGVLRADGRRSSRSTTSSGSTRRPRSALAFVARRLRARASGCWSRGAASARCRWTWSTRAS